MLLSVFVFFSMSMKLSPQKSNDAQRIYSMKGGVVEWDETGHWLLPNFYIVVCLFVLILIARQKNKVTKF